MFLILFLQGLQWFTNISFKVNGVMPIVILLDVTLNPLVMLGVWSPIPDNYFTPEYMNA